MWRSSWSWRKGKKQRKELKANSTAKIPSFNGNKGKTFVELLRAAPALIVYYHVRMAGFVWRAAQLRLGVSRIERVSPATLARDLPQPPDGRG